MLNLEPSLSAYWYQMFSGTMLIDIIGRKLRAGRPLCPIERVSCLFFLTGSQSAPLIKLSASHSQAVTNSASTTTLNITWKNNRYLGEAEQF